MARRVVRGLLLLEAAGLLGALLLYRAMDRSQGAAGLPGAAPRGGPGTWGGRGRLLRAGPRFCKEVLPCGVGSSAGVSADAQGWLLGRTP